MSAIEFTPEELDAAQARLEVRDLRAQDIPPDAATILRRIAAKYATSVDDIKSHKVSKRLVMVRKEVYAALRAAGYSYPEIGAAVGGRDHTTIMSGIKPRKAVGA